MRLGGGNEWAECAGREVFVPAKDFGESMGFYEAMGWRVNWRAEDDSLAELELAGNRVYLQNFYV